MINSKSEIKCLMETIHIINIYKLFTIIKLIRNYVNSQAFF